MGWDTAMKQLWEGPWLCPHLTKPAQAKQTQISLVSAAAVQRVIGIWFVHPVMTESLFRCFYRKQWKSQTEQTRRNNFCLDLRRKSMSGPRSERCHAWVTVPGPCTSGVRGGRRLGAPPHPCPLGGLRPRARRCRGSGPRGGEAGDGVRQRGQAGPGAGRTGPGGGRRRGGANRGGRSGRGTCVLRARPLGEPSRARPSRAEPSEALLGSASRPAPPRRPRP